MECDTLAHHNWFGRSARSDKVLISKQTWLAHNAFLKVRPEHEILADFKTNNS